MQPAETARIPWWRLPLAREHGAWVQLGVALLTGLWVAPNRGAAAGIALAGLLLFLAREPLAVAMGHRSKRRQVAEGALRARQAAGLALLAAGAAAPVLVLRWQLLWQPHVFQQIAVAAAVGGTSAWTVRINRDRTPSGELIAAWAVAALGSAVAALGGADPVVVNMLLWSWGSAFALDTLAVHAAKIRMLSADPPIWARHAWLPLLVVAGFGGFGLLGDGGLAPAATVWLVGGTGALGSAVVRRPRHLVPVGIALAGVCALALFFW